MKSHVPTTIRLVIYSLVAVAVASPATAAATPATTYRVEISEETLERWIRYRRSRAGDRHQEMEAFALTQALAEEALRRRLDWEPAVRVELLRQDAQILRGRLKNALAEEVTVPDEDLRAQLEVTKAKPRRVRIRNLFLRFAPLTDDADRERTLERAKVLRQQVIAGADFAQLAAEHSDSQTRLQGGLLGNVRPGQYEEPLNTVLLELEEGEVSEPFVTRDGVAIFYCDGVLPATHLTEEERYELAHKKMRGARERFEWSEFLRGVLEASALEIDWEAIRASGDAEDVVIQHASGLLTRAELQTFFQRGLEEIPPAQLEERVTEFVVRVNLVHAAAHRGVDRLDEVVDARRFKRLETLATAAMAALIQERLEPITDDAIREEYERSLLELERPHHFDVSVVALPLDPNDLSASHARALSILGVLQSGAAPFDDVAREHSVHSSSTEGGRLRSISRPQLSNVLGVDLTREILRLEIAQLSDVVREHDLWWIVRLDSIEEPRFYTLEEARDAVENRLGNRQVQVLQPTIVDEWLERIELRVMPVVAREP